ncbi:MAG: tRNA glutamyl-Q(34) synthetase GluQRS [Ilumatobacteraceae bacterium]|nr:tRNA glutamyl-Q(34) synthetase GluQRS [Ilumatobacteraceae bacterium]
MRGRFAPSPTGTLHLGNLRTALVAWLSARAQLGEFIVRMEDLDQVTSSRVHERRQLADLAALGMTSDGPVVRQSDRFDLHRTAVAELDRRGLVYQCFCTRREIRDAASAPHGDPMPEGAYPGTCRDMTVAARNRMQAEGRPAALRLRAGGRRITIVDAIAGPVEGMVDDVVLVRNDGVPAYNLAVVVDDHLQGVTEVVRGDDLLSSTPRQVHLQQLLGFATPAYAHVPLVSGTDGQRLAKRHGATTLAELADLGVDPPRVLSMLGASLHLCEIDDAVSIQELADGFSFDRIPTAPWTFDVATVPDLPR